MVRVLNIVDRISVVLMVVGMLFMVVGVDRLIVIMVSVKVGSSWVKLLCSVMLNRLFFDSIWLRKLLI